MAENIKHELINEVERKLDDIFGEDNGELAAHSERKEYPLRNLKEMVLSIDWEISDKSMAGFLKEVDRLKQQYQEDKITVSFLKMLAGVGRYINAKRAKAHPSSIKLLSPIYLNLEKVISSNKLTDTDKRRILFSDIRKFKKLKEEIALAKAPINEIPAKEIEPLMAEKEAGLDMDEMTVKEATAYTLKEIKNTIKNECAAIRAEILKLKQEE
jgi:pilus assembly protein FimV